ncbi:GntR family transcriptional regulator [Alicyclobacillus acidoterrestris]|uniref:GntR family transcriptional regulator n=1 Tax=Alicyclobacillus acidoterrestris (strain ATCC 49025 / DSM 3922 / CIP 106132 / NCIMB 13137 / GD3B) TaxID=1356854 RepID=T0CJ97_ALIAG|nr:GntR family transcriptional regulator [Alicyclobacillus acidoterrestris]EPZ52909.1 hypothetical protein N007_02065 [Alicyclobacillus acidoterrestris ATCC 49025]UNO49121.1 GntR family transcriptional regulator [Alicyclobacillus acidoterrestris]
MDGRQAETAASVNIGLKGLTTKKVKSLRDTAVDTIREAIISGELAPGVHLKERELSAIMGISTTPIKEALRVLEQIGFVTTIPRKGTFVSDIVNTLSEFFMIRANLEGLAARFAAEKVSDLQIETLRGIINRMKTLVDSGDTEQLEPLNTRFHGTIHQFSENPMLTQILGNITSVDRSFRRRALQYEGEVELGFYEHRGICEAICSRNGELAELRMREHIFRTTGKVLKNLNANHHR